ncbi:carboxymuconolactone decarboxylase family protein [Parasphingorhabdus pacifica]
MTETTGPRFDLANVTPTTFGELHELTRRSEEHARESSVDPRLIELVRLRASQINGCGYCQDMHTRQAREAGETEERLQELATWQESTHFDGAERAALQLTESVTLLHGGKVPEEDYRPAQEHFDEKQIVGLVWTIGLINTYNRLAIAMAPEV